MIMADKISELRKKCGWTQESFAYRLGVTRQAISKWESAQSVPDLKNLEKMSQLFNVSIDFLIKDELDMADLVSIENEVADDNIWRSVSLQEASEYLAFKDQSASKIALGAALCVLGFVPLIVLGILSEVPRLGINANHVVLVGLSLLFVFIIWAVVIFLGFGLKGTQFKYLTQERIDTAYGVTGIVKEYKAKLQPQRIINVVTGVVLCISALALLVVSGPLVELWGEQWQAISVGLSLVLVAIAVYLFVSIGIRWEAAQLLLHEGEWYSSQHRTENRMELITRIYWLTITAIYLAYSFFTSDWGRSWVIWPIAGVVFGIIYSAMKYRVETKQNQQNKDL